MGVIEATVKPKQYHEGVLQYELVVNSSDELLSISLLVKHDKKFDIYIY